MEKKFEQKENKQAVSQIEKDIEHLSGLGYAQELYRTIGGFSNFAITFSVISVLSGLMMLYGYGIELVGKASIWTWVIVGFFQLILALGLGEIASIYPLAGGVYKWTGHLVNPHVGWFCGSFSLVGWFACTAGIEYGLAIFLTAYLGLNGDIFLNTVGLLAVIVMIHAVLNIFGIKIVSKLNDISVNLHVVGVVFIVILLYTFGNETPTAFDQIQESQSFFSISFLQALLMSAWTLTAFDASANVSEESINPSKVVPWGMVTAAASSLFLGIILLLSLNHSLSSPAAAVGSDLPAAMFVLYDSLGSAMYKFVMIFVLLAQFTAGLSSQAVTIRIIYSFSRDRGIPYSSYLKKVSHKYETPVYSIILTGLITFIICLFSKFLPMITSLSTMGLYFSYTITFAAAIWGHKIIRENKNVFNLGRFSRLVHLISFFWALFVTAIMVVPPVGHHGLLFLLLVFAFVLVYVVYARKIIEDY